MLPRTLDDLAGLRAAHWGRESTGRQADRFGPAAQREQRARAIERYEMVDTGIEWLVAHSGQTIRKTAQFGEMLALAGHDYDVLVVGYVSRLARDLRTAVNARHDLHQAGAVLLFADERLLSSDEDAWEHFARESVEAEAYSRRLGKRIHEGYEVKRRECQDQGGGLVPFGFRRAGSQKLIEPDPDAMPRALEVWHLAAQGLPDQAIALQTGLTLWRVRGVLRSPLFRGQLRDGRATRFDAPVDAEILESALAFRRQRTRAGNRLRRNRVYPLSCSGPLMCDACGLAIKGDTRTRRNGEKVAVYRHREGGPCQGWPVREVPAEVLEEQVAALLEGAVPNREASARIRAALQRPVVEPDRLAIARLDARLKALATEIASSESTRDTEEIVSDIEATKRERERLAKAPKAQAAPAPDEVLAWLASLGKLWRETSDDGRRRLAIAIFERIGVAASPERGSHRIVSIELTAEAERRGLLLALPASLEVTMVGDTGFEPVTSRM